MRRGLHASVRTPYVMVRPLSGANALSEAMAAQFETIRREGGQG